MIQDTALARALRIEKKSKPRAKPDPVDVEAECEALAAGLPPPLVAKCRADLVGKSGAKLTPVGWRNALRELREAAARHGADANQAIADSMQTYVTRYAGERPVAYLVGIVRGWAPAGARSVRSIRGPAPPTPHAAFGEGDSVESVWGPLAEPRGAATCAT
jgi:hypothetical protein